MLEIRACEFKGNSAKSGGAFFFKYGFPYESLVNTESKFENNSGLNFGNNMASLPFRLILINSFNRDFFNFSDVIRNLSLIKVKPGKKFDLNFKLYAIDQFDQNALSMIKNEYYLYFMHNN